MFGKTVYGTTFKDVNFVPLQSATFCIQCELISTNSRPYCLACGNTSLLSLSVFWVERCVISRRPILSPTRNSTALYGICCARCPIHKS